MVPTVALAGVVAALCAAQPAGIIGSIIGAVIALLIWTSVGNRSHTRI